MKTNLLDYLIIPRLSIMGWDDAIIAGAIAAGSSAIGGAASQPNTNSANLWNAQMAKEQMLFQERMRDTMYQSAVRDLKKAGLNPMMAYGNIHTAAPSGVSPAPAQVASRQALGGGIASAGQAVAQSLLNKSTIDLQASQTKSNQASSQELATRSQLNAENALKSIQDRQTSSAQEAREKAQTENIARDTINKNLEASRIQASTNLSNAQAAEAFSRQDVNRKTYEQMSTRDTGLKNQQQLDQSWYGKNVRPWLKDIPFFNSGSQAFDRLTK